MSSDAAAYTSRASTTLRSSPAWIRATAAETACCHCAAVRLPSCQRSSAGGSAGRTGTGGAGRPIVVSQARPSRRPSTVAGTTSTEPSEVGSKVKLPRATSPVPATPTSSLTSALSNSSVSHFSPEVNRSAPAGMLTRAASPQPTSPSPPRIQATEPECGRRATRSPGSATGTVRTTRRSGAGWLGSSRWALTADNFTCGNEPSGPRAGGWRTRPGGERGRGGSRCRPGCRVSAGAFASRDRWGA